MLYDLKEVTRVHQGRTILDIPALTISTGRIYSLIGPNGAGKTTLLHLLAFLDIPSSGGISFRSAEVRFVERALQPLRRQVVLVDQYPILFTGSVRRNLEFGLKVRKIERKRRRQLIEEALEMVGMSGFIDAEAHKLSGGETKRIALARALVVRPAVLLCDEPTANVDTENAEIILGILERANREGLISIIFATHSLTQAQRLAHHTLILKDGRLSDLSRENVFSATVQGQAGGRVVYRLHNEVRITVPAASHPEGRGSVRLFLDPAKITLRREADGGAGRENLVPGKVVRIAADKGRVKTTVDTGVPIDLFLSLAKYQMIQPQIGEKVVLEIDDQAITSE
jgi:tungstate transport system ATP-binding protein